VRGFGERHDLAGVSLPAQRAAVAGANFDFLASSRSTAGSHGEIARFDAFADLHLGSKVADFGDLG